MMKTMKIWAMLAAGLALAAGANGQSLLLENPFRQAVQGAILEEARAEFSAAPIPSGTPVAILPIAGDADGWLAGQLKIALTQAGKHGVEGKEDPMWDEILKEITWDEHKEPFLDPKTIDAFGRLQSAKILLSGAVRSLDYTPRCAYFEIELHATEIATKRHLWGAVCAKRHYAPGIRPIGRVSDLPAELRQAMQDGLRDKLADSLSAAGSLRDAGRIALLPLAADEQDYVGGLVRDSMLRASLHAVNADWGTLGEARTGLRDPGRPADAVLHGSVRDLSYDGVELSPATVAVGYRAEVQLDIETADGTVLWSDTLAIGEVSDRQKGLWATLVRLFPSLDAHPARAVWVPPTVLLGLFLLGWLLRATTRVR